MIPEIFPDTPFYARGNCSGEVYLVVGRNSSTRRLDCEYDVLPLVAPGVGIVPERADNLTPISGTLMVEDDELAWTDLPEPGPTFPDFPFFARGLASGGPFMVVGDGCDEETFTAIYLSVDYSAGNRTDGLIRDFIEVIDNPFG